MNTESTDLQTSRCRTSLSRATLVVGTILAAAALGGCGSSGSVTVPDIGPARQFTLGGFSPTAPVRVDHPVNVSFTIKLPSGQALTKYKTGSGPHTGVHLIIVRDDLAYIIHKHPPIAASGLLRQTITFPAPGPYRVLVDAYPNIGGEQPNFQLHTSVRVAGAYRPKALPPFQEDPRIDGYHFDMHGNPHIHSIQAQFLHVDVTDPQGRQVTFQPWYGALAHAIFFREGSLDYFHTHICAPDAPNCGTLPGVPATRISGRATAPGKLTIGVLLPAPGIWRLFLQLRQGRRILTAPYTLKVT